MLRGKKGGLEEEREGRRAVTIVMGRKEDSGKEDEGLQLAVQCRVTGAA